VAQWAAFAGLTVLSVSLFLVLARASQTMVSDGTATDVEETADSAPAPGFDTPGLTASDAENPVEDSTDAGSDPDTDVVSPDRSDAVVSDPPSAPESPSIGDDRVIESDPDDGDRPGGDSDRSAIDDADNGSGGARPRPSIDSLSTSALLLNVAFSQGIFGGLVVLAAWYTEVPLAALGVPELPTLGTLALGAGLGIALYAGNELAAAGANALGFSPPENLREMLAPDSAAGWVLLLIVILPAIAFVEELLFRAALIGALSTGFAISPWPLVVLSSIAFALGHGAQGSLGVIVTGSLGLLLATAFVLTGSLFVVVLAHYLVNALEFVVHEGLGIEWSA
jgi:membrane protease YdiL (CAAX protease family)